MSNSDTGARSAVASQSLLTRKLSSPQTSAPESTSRPKNSLSADAYSAHPPTLLDGACTVILAASDLGDFGWTDAVNAARVATEQNLSVAGTRLITGLFTPESAFDTATKAIQQYDSRVVLSFSPQHGNAMAQIAAAYPSVTVAYVGPPVAGLPNLSTMSLDERAMF